MITWIIVSMLFGTPVPMSHYPVFPKRHWCERYLHHNPYAAQYRMRCERVYTDIP